MIAMPLSRVALLAGGRVAHCDDAEAVRIEGVSTDTRVLPDAQGRAVLFVALKGDNFDGHDHLAKAHELGAVAALVSAETDVAMPQIVVADTQLALAALARGLQWERKTQVFALTGSNGKTSVKQLVTSILDQAGGAYATPGNRNNEIGLPLAVIDAPEDACYAIYEMGAGQPGDIAYLTDIVRPDIALVNNIAPAHLERMGSLLGVADTKAAIYDALPANGVAVINADDAFAPYFAERAHGRHILRFALDASADVFARDVRLSADGSVFELHAPGHHATVRFPLPGRHNIANALAAATMALGGGIAFDAIVAGLESVQPVAGRLLRHALASNITLIDDSYNANPGSLNAAIDTLAFGEGQGWLVLGDMRELGADAEDLHAQAGRRAKQAGVARLFVLGALSAAAASSFGEGAAVFDSHEALAKQLRNELNGVQGVVRVLVKGSRGSAMDRIVDALLQREGSVHAA